MWQNSDYRNIFTIPITVKSYARLALLTMSHAMTPVVTQVNSKQANEPSPGIIPGQVQQSIIFINPGIHSNVKAFHNEARGE